MFLLFIAASSWGKPQVQAFRDGYLLAAWDERSTPTMKKDNTMQSSEKWEGNWFFLFIPSKGLTTSVSLYLLDATVSNWLDFFFLCFVFISILNKLTPEKFDKLCLELLNVGVDTKLVLKGIVLLVMVSLFLNFFYLNLPCALYFYQTRFDCNFLFIARLLTKPSKSPSTASYTLNYVNAWQRMYQTLRTCPQKVKLYRNRTA